MITFILDTLGLALDFMYITATVIESGEWHLK